MSNCTRVIGLLLVSALYGVAAENSRVVVVNAGDSTATIYDAVRISTGDASLKSVKVLPTGKSPNEVCISPDGKRAFVSNRGETSVTVIDIDAATVLTTISDPAMKNPDGCIVQQDGSKLYVAAAGAASVFVFSTSDYRKVNEIRVGNEPRRLLFSPDGKRLYVSNGDDKNVSVIDAGTLKTISTIKAGRDARAMIFTSDGKYLVISNVSDDAVEFVKDGETEPEYVVGVPKSPQRLVAYPAKQIIFAIGRVDGVVSMLEMRPNNEFGRTLGTIPVGRGPWGMALSAAGDCLYVANTTDNTISIIDLRLMRPSFTIQAGKGPMGLAVR